MKKSPLKQLTVYLLVAFGLLIFLGFSWIIGSSKNSFLARPMIYRTLLQESDGLFVGTKVTIHGKNTGNVIKTTLMPDGSVELHFAVRKSHAFSVTESSRVQLKNSGALGDRFINIVTKDLSARQLKKGSLIPYEESFSLISALTSSDGDLQKNLPKMIEKIDEILNKLNKEGFAGLLPKEGREDLSQTLKSARSILKKVDSGQGTLGALVNDRDLYHRLLSLLGKRPAKNYLKDLSKKSQQKK